VKTARKIKAISRLLLILLLLLAMIIGSIFSYMIVVGYYLNIEINVPEETSLAITDVTFNPLNATAFTVTLLNPTYSAGDANITEILIASKDNKLHTVTTTAPQLPFELKKGKETTIQCNWNWGNFTDQTIRVMVTVEDGSGSTYTIQTANVMMTFTPNFSGLDTSQFNLTLRSIEKSESKVTLTNITVTTENGDVFNINLQNQTLPKLFLAGDEVEFICLWDWTDYQNTTIIINALTSEGFKFYYVEHLPSKSKFDITNITFDASDMTSFEIDVKIAEDQTLNSTKIAVVGVILSDSRSALTVLSPELPYDISPTETVHFEVEWEWEAYSGQDIIIGVETEAYDYGYVGYTVP
jgi:hypothetical protein